MGWQGVPLKLQISPGRGVSQSTFLLIAVSRYNHCPPCHNFRPEYREDPSQTSEVIQEEMSEVSLQADDHVEDHSDSEDEAPVFLDLTGLRPGRELEGDAGTGLDSALEGTVGAQEWRLEVERVLPSLKIHIRQDNRVCGVQWSLPNQDTQSLTFGAKQHQH